MANNTDILALISTEADKAVDQIIVDSKRLHTIVNGTGIEQVAVEDGSLVPTVRKALLDNLSFKTPPLPWKNGSSVTEFNQLYNFQDVNGNVTWWYSPGATATNPSIMRDSPINDGKFRVFLDKTNISDIFAPILSPDFKGNPRVPLVQKGDDTNSIASTQWVQREMKYLADLVTEAISGEFEDITVRRNSVLNNLSVSGAFNVTSDKISAPTTEATFNRIRVVGNTAEVSFEDNGAPPVDVTTKTNLKPYSVSTGIGSIDSLSAGRAKIGNIDASTNSLDVDGLMIGDYLHLQGNSKQPATRPQLIVDGIADIKTLRVTDPIEGIVSNVDGLDIKPRSVAVSEGLSVTKDTSLAGKLSVVGDTRVGNLEVTGTLSGVSVSVDGKDIKPRNVETTSIKATENVSVDGSLSVTGKVSVQEIQVSGPSSFRGPLNALDGGPLSIPSASLSRIAVVPLTQDITTPTYTFNPNFNMQNLTLKAANIKINPPSALPVGMALTYIIYFEQDAVGGRLVVWDPKFIPLNPEAINLAPNSITMVQLLYRGVGDVYDKVVTQRP